MSQSYERTHSIIEDLRADIDFEIDDVIASIVRGLPEDYFKSLSGQDQMKQLKALLAMRICQLDDEITLRSENGRQISVVATNNYSGQLADILSRLPEEPALLGARIFTSSDHDFIIDVFDFESSAPEDGHSEGLEPVLIELVIDEVVALTHAPSAEVQAFVNHYPPTSRILRAVHQLAEQFLAYREIGQTQDLVVRWNPAAHRDQTRVTISVGRYRAKQVFQRTATFLGQHQLDIERAYLHEVPQSQGAPVAVASFLVRGKESVDIDREFMARQLAEFLIQNQPGSEASTR